MKTVAKVRPLNRPMALFFALSLPLECSALSVTADATLQMFGHKTAG